MTIIKSASSTESQLVTSSTIETIVKTNLPSGTTRKLTQANSGVTSASTKISMENLSSHKPDQRTVTVPPTGEELLFSELYNNPDKLKNDPSFRKIFVQTLKNWENSNVNPYEFMTSEVLDLLSKAPDVDPAIRENAQFQKDTNVATTASLDGSKTIDLNTLPMKFPLNNVLTNESIREDFGKNAKMLAAANPTPDDRYDIPGFKDFFDAQKLTAIQTSGTNNSCAFHAALLAWFDKKGLYKPQLNGALGKYVETVVSDGFRKEIGDMVDPKNKKLKNEVTTKGKMVGDDVFKLIAQKLDTEIILFKLNGEAEYYSKEGESNPLVSREQVLKDHPNALLICHNGTNHYAVVRKLNETS